MVDAVPGVLALWHGFQGRGITNSLRTERGGCSQVLRWRPRVGVFQRQTTILKGPTAPDLAANFCECICAPLATATAALPLCVDDCAGLVWGGRVSEIRSSAAL